MATNKDPRIDRKHQTLETREEQIKRNMLSVSGGKPYIEERLSRYPSESDTSWFGDTTRTESDASNSLSHIPGRKDRAYNINYPKRITTKPKHCLLYTSDAADE